MYSFSSGYGVLSSVIFILPVCGGAITHTVYIS